MIGDGSNLDVQEGVSGQPLGGEGTFADALFT